jgi:hypothetical protein
VRRHARVCFAIAALASFFVFAGSASAEVPCVNAQIRDQQRASFLSDCRAYEMVSPADKNDNDVLGDEGRGRAAVGGGGLLFSSFGGFSKAEGVTGAPMYIASRDIQGWTTRPLLPKEDQNGRFTAVGKFEAVRDDLGTSVVRAGDPGLTPNAQPGTANAYLRDNGGAYSLLTPVGMQLGIGQIPQGFFAVAALGADNRVVFESSLKLTPDASVDKPDGVRFGVSPAGTNIYEYLNGELRLVSVLPDPDGAGPLDETAAPEGAYTGPGAVVESNKLGGATEEAYTEDMHVLSDDGSRIFWTDWEKQQIYVRIDRSRTVWVSRSQRSVPDPGGERPAVFRGATPDGRFVFFTSQAKLTDDSQAEPGSPELYRYDLQEESLEDLTPAPTAQALGVIGYSDDGQTVYFAAYAHLAPGSDTVPDETEAFTVRPKVYMWSHGTTSYVATVAGNENPASTDDRNWALYRDGAFKESRVSADGRYLLLRSDAYLSEQRNGIFERVPPQMFLYDSSDPDKGMRCVSCSPDGAIPIAAGVLGVPRQDGKLPALTPRLINPLLPGGRVVFTTTQSLLPADRNGKRDVYLWADDGQSLLSTGKSDSDSYFLDASGDGTDIFIATRERLVGADIDANVDAYDVRVGGGFEEPPAPLPPCTGEACQGSGGGARALSGIATSAVNSQGNLSQRKASRPRCAKNARPVKKRGQVRCMKKRQPKRSNAHAKPTATRRHG